MLHFIGELLRSSALGCSAWDVVGHLFSEFSRASGRLVRAECGTGAASHALAVPCCRGCPWQRGARHSRAAGHSAPEGAASLSRALQGLGWGSDGCFPRLSCRQWETLAW